MVSNILRVFLSVFSIYDWLMFDKWFSYKSYGSSVDLSPCPAHMAQTKRDAPPIQPEMSFRKVECET